MCAVTSPKGNQIILCVWFCHISDVLAQLCELTALTDSVRNISSIIHVVLIESQKQSIRIAAVLLATIYFMRLILVKEKYYSIFQLLMILQKKIESIVIAMRRFHIFYFFLYISYWMLSLALSHQNRLSLLEPSFKINNLLGHLLRLIRFIRSMIRY